MREFRIRITAAPMTAALATSKPLRDQYVSKYTP